MAEVIRYIEYEDVCHLVERLFLEANINLPEDVLASIEEAHLNETHPVAHHVLGKLVENAQIARETHLPICQDTGVACVWVEMGQAVHIKGGNLEKAIQEGVRSAYLKGSFRCSVVRDPLFDRQNTNDNTPAFVHVRIVEGDRLHIVCMPKGFGSENMSALKMFSPSSTKEDIVAFVKDAVVSAAGKPCPPLVLGIGIGGTFDTVAGLAKEALLVPINTPHGNPSYAMLEDEIKCEINKTGIGAQGFGGDTTVLSVKIKTAPTHIAGLPVAVCFGCHACRKAEGTI